MVIVVNFAMSISRQKFIKDMSELSVNISKQLVYGTGDPTITNYEERVKTGVGHCGDFAYLLNKTLYERNIDCKVVDLKSEYEGLIHTVVIVNYFGEIVIDPTLGIVYSVSLNKLIENSDKLYKYSINPNGIESIYFTKEFYKNIKDKFVYKENPFGLK